MNHLRRTIQRIGQDVFQSTLSRSTAPLLTYNANYATKGTRRNLKLEIIYDRRRRISYSEGRSSNKTEQPWFVEQELEEEEITIKQKEEETKDTMPTTTQAPETLPANIPNNIPNHLKELLDYLIDSPFFDPTSITFIDAKLEQGLTAWTDWVVLASLKIGRESSYRGATDAVKSIVRVEGINPSTSSSAQDVASKWVLVDAGNVVVHILTSKSREIYALEDVWRNPDYRNSSL